MSEIFSNLYCVFIFQTHFIYSTTAKFLVSGGFRVFLNFLLFLFSFSAFQLGDVIAQKNAKLTENLSYRRLWVVSVL